MPRCGSEGLLAFIDTILSGVFVMFLAVVVGMGLWPNRFRPQDQVRRRGATVCGVSARSLRIHGPGCVLGCVTTLAAAGLIETIAEYGFQIAVTSGLNSIIAIVGGLVITQFVWEMDWIHAAGDITGGHTDTKGLAAAIDATDSDEVAAGYGNTYPFAILAMVIYAKVLVAVVPL